MIKNLKSNCCNAEIKTNYDPEGTGCYICTKCEKGCDPKEKGCGAAMKFCTVGGGCSQTLRCTGRCPECKPDQVNDKLAEAKKLIENMEQAFWNKYNIAYVHNRGFATLGTEIVEGIKKYLAAQDLISREEQREDDFGSVVIGNFEILNSRTEGKIWISGIDGEGGEFDIALLEPIIAEFYKKYL